MEELWGKTRLSVEDIEKKAKNIRKKLIRMNSHAGAGHTGADLSEADILAVLYFGILNVSKADLNNANRDRFILSKGHGVGGYYCTLAEAGFIPEEELRTYLKAESRLPGHPVRQKTPGIEMNTGALGHGLPVGVGLALSAKIQRKNYMTYVLTGDGELEEGSNWEAAMCAAHYRLDNLVVIVDRNTLQLADKTERIIGLEPLDKKWEAFGFKVYSVDGHNIGELLDLFESIDTGIGMPHVVIARTIKGKGVSFIEGKAEWHHRIPVGNEFDKAIEELE